MMTKTERIAQRCKWEYERAEERGDTRVAQVLAYCLLGATHGPTPDPAKPEYIPLSNTVRLLNSVGGEE